MIKQNKGFTLIELLIIIGVIAISVISIYVSYQKREIAAKADRQVALLAVMNEKIGEFLINTSNTNAAVSVPVVNNRLTVANLLASNIVPQEMILGANIVNLFGGQVTFGALGLDVTPANGIADPVPLYTVTLTNIPAAACYRLGSHSKFDDVQRIFVNGVMVKNVGDITVNEVALSANCNTNDFNNSIRYETKLYTRGNEVPDNTTAVGGVRPKEGAFNIAPPATAVASGGAFCTGGAFWDGVASVCTCGPGFHWNGTTCLALGTSGVCPLGQGWDLNTNTCSVLPVGTGGVPLTPAPALAGFVQSALLPSGGAIPSVQGAGREVPSNIVTPAQEATSLYTACVGASPAAATPATNPGGSWDNKVCQMCINGFWNGARCVTP